MVSTHVECVPQTAHDAHSDFLYMRPDVFLLVVRRIERLVRLLHSHLELIYLVAGMLIAYSTMCLLSDRNLSKFYNTRR